MTEIDKSNSLIIYIDSIHPNDGLAQYRKELEGKRFDAFITFSNISHEGWSTIAGTFVDETGIPEIDEATTDHPITISIAKYSL